METERGLVAVPSADELSAEITRNSIFQELLGDSISNFDGDARKKMVLDLLANTSKCSKGEKADGRTFAIKYFAFKRTEWEGKGGQLNQAVRTVILDEDLNALDFSSDGVAQSIALIVRRLGLVPFNPPVKVKIRHRDMPSGHVMFDLVPVVE